MANSNEERIDLRGDGRVILYKRAGLRDPVWQVRIRVPNSTGYKRVTTKTADRREAERFALNYYEELYIHVKTGGSIQSKTFKQVFTEWEKHLATMGHTRRGGSWDDTVERVRTYAVKFFGPMKIDTIGPVQFADYWVWRKKNYNQSIPNLDTSVGTSSRLPAARSDPTFQCGSHRRSDHSAPPQRVRPAHYAIGG